jgi:hypothetical protein
VSLSKFAKTLDKKLRPEQGALDLTMTSNKEEAGKSTNDEDAERDRVILECLLHHFYGEGLFGLGDRLVEETGLPGEKKALKEPYIRLVELLAALRAGDVGPSLAWATTELGDERLQFELTRLHYVGLLRAGRAAEALRFAQRSFPAFGKTFNGEIETLMGCLAFSNRLEVSPYRNYLAMDGAFLTGAVRSLSIAYCKAMRVPQESAFGQCIRLGVQSLPRINRVMALMKERKGVEWSQQDELPVEMDLPAALRHHSVFVCPVLRQQATADNPPMMLPCGHVICKEALTRLSKQTSLTRFKCPYCPSESTSANAQQVFF